MPLLYGWQIVWLFLPTSQPFLDPPQFVASGITCSSKSLGYEPHLVRSGVEFTPAEKPHEFHTPEVLACY